MPDIVSDANTRVAWVPTIANIQAPTTTELNAGMLLHSTMSADGLVGFRPETADVPNTKLDSDFNTVDVGRTNLSGTMLRLFKQSGTDTIYDTLIKGAAGYVVIRRSVAASTAWTTGQKVQVYPAKCGETAWLDPEENTDERYEVPIKVTAKPALRAAVA